MPSTPSAPGEPACADDPADDAVGVTLRVARVFAAITAASIAGAGSTVTLPQLRVLVLVADAGSLHTGAVADALGVHLSNASRICDRLVQAGLLSRTEDPTNRRRSRLAPTAAGSALLVSVTDQRRTAFGEILDDMPLEERAAVVDAFARFARAGERHRLGGAGTAW